MTAQELASAITDAVFAANRTRELDRLAGLPSEDAIDDPFATLIGVLDQGRELALAMRDHAHTWVVDEEADWSRCAVCGADGNA